MILEAKNISFQYGKDTRLVLENFNFQMESRERVGIIAPSGFGKTTLCKVLAGYEKPNTGEILLDGKPLASYKGYCPVQMIWQHPELMVNPRRRMHSVLEEGDGITERIVNGLGIKDEWKNRFPSELSGGELQRFCIARALGERTKFILADEISTMLDLITQSEIWRFLIQETREREMGLLVVSHSWPLLENVCTRMCDMETKAAK